MKTSNRTWFTLAITIIFIGIFIGYRYGFSERFFNLNTKTAVIDLKQKNKVVLIEKHKEQGQVYQIEFRVSGNLSDNITLHISENGKDYTRSIRVKKGKVDTSFLTPWQADQAYILIENKHDSRSQIEVDYQFLAK